MTKRFLVAVSVAETDVKFINFQNYFTQNMQLAAKGQFEVSVDYVTSVEGIEICLDRAAEEYDLVITYDNLQGISIGKGTIKKWKKTHPATRVILLLPDEKKGRGKMAFFYQMGYYDVVFYSDFKVPFIMDLLNRSRTEEEACAYYGISFVEQKKESETDVATLQDSSLNLSTGSDELDQVVGANRDILNVNNEVPLTDISEHIGAVEPAELSSTSFEDFSEEADEEFSEEDDVYGEDIYPESSDHYEEDEEPLPPVNQDEVEVYAEMVFRDITKTDPATYNSWTNHMRSDQELEEYIRKKIEIYQIPDAYISKVYDSLWSFFWGYDVLTPLLDEVEISDIHVNFTDSIYVRRQGKLYKTKVHFRSDDHYRSFVNQFATSNNKSITDDDAIVSFSDSRHPLFHQRVALTTEYISATRLPYLRIRKTSKIKYTFSQLIGFDMLDEKQAAYLIERVNQDYCFIISGKGGSGKSTLTNTCIDVINGDKSGLVIQENFELFTHRDDLDMMFENLMVDNNVKKSDLNPDGTLKKQQAQYDLKKLATMGLLQDLDYFIISETKGTEAMEFINLWYSGHRCWTTLHSDHAVHNLDKLVGYAMPGSLYSKEELMQMVCDHAVLIHMKNFKIDEIVEACGWDEDKEQVKYKTVFMLNEQKKPLKKGNDKTVA